MTFTAQLGTANSMPGNIALGFLPPEGGGTGGPAPSASALASTLNASASHSTPTVLGNSQTPGGGATHQKPGS